MEDNIWKYLQDIKQKNKIEKQKKGITNHKTLIDLVI